MIKKDKFLKRGIAISLASISIALPVTNTVYAMEPESSTPQMTSTQEIQQNDMLANLEIKTLKDTDDEKIVKVIEGNTVSTSTYNKKEDSLRVVIEKDGEVMQDETTKGIQNNNNENNELEYSSKATARATVSMKSLYSKLKYSINMKSWTITNTKGSVKKRPETKSHQTNLYRFKSSLDACRRDENVASASLVGFQASVISAAVTGAMSGGIGSIISILGSIGAPISAANSLWSATKHMKDADRYFAIL